MERPPRNCRSIYAKVKEEGNGSPVTKPCKAMVVPIQSSDMSDSPKRRRIDRWDSEADNSPPGPIHNSSQESGQNSSHDVMEGRCTPVEDSKELVRLQCGGSLSTQHGAGPSNADSGIGSEITCSGGESDSWLSSPGYDAPDSSRIQHHAEVASDTAEESLLQTGHEDVETEHVQAMASIELLKSRVNELKRTRLELDRTKMELAEVREESRKDMAELERRAQIDLAATVSREVEAIKKQAQKEVEAAQAESENYQAAVKAEAEKNRHEMERLAREQLESLRRQAEKELETERGKVKKAVQAAGERWQKKVESVQRHMQGKVDAAERERKKQVETVQRQMQGKVDAAEREIRKNREEIQKEARKEVEMFERKAELAARKYNKLIAEYNVLDARISDAANLLCVGKSVPQKDSR